MAELRDGFDGVADIYDRVRPTYPAFLFDELFSYLVEEPEIVEIGPGTGQATGSLLEHLASVTAVELGPQLANILQRNFDGQQNLRVLVSAFEDVDLPKHCFDAVVSATAFHWVPWPTRLQKSFELLRPNGWLAIIETVQVEAMTDNDFFFRAQRIYSRHGEAATSLPTPELASSQFLDELCETALFENPTLTRYRWDQTYTTASYVDLMKSYSTTQAMPHAKQVALLAEMAAFIDEDFGGSVTRPLVITLTMAQAAQE